jgi:hypothetical protein
MYNDGMSLTALSHTVLPDGQDVGSFAVSPELTTAQAAWFLRTSEGYINEMLNAGHIAFHLDNGERLIQWESLSKFEQEQKWVREGLEKITRLSEEMELYDD